MNTRAPHALTASDGRRAIRALLSGALASPDLRPFRPLSPDPRADVARIARAANLSPADVELASLPPEGDDYAARVRAYEAQGMTTSDAQGTVDAEELTALRAANTARV